MGARLAAFVGVLGCLGVGSSAAALTPTLGYSGRLFTADGTPADGTYDIAFRLYDGPDAPAQLLFEEGFDAVTVNDGYFWVLLANNEGGTLTRWAAAAVPAAEAPSPRCRRDRA